MVWISFAVVKGEELKVYHVSLFDRLICRKSEEDMRGHITLIDGIVVLLQTPMNFIFEKW